MTGPEPPRPTLAASVACFRDGKVLIARRGRPPSKGVWSLPGGRIELGETAAEAASREIEEETGVTAEILGLADLVELFYRDEAGAIERHIVILAFAGRWISGDGLPTDEAEAVAWVAPDELDGYETTKGLSEAIMRAAELVK